MPPITSAEHMRRLRASLATGHVPTDLIPLVQSMIERSDPHAASQAPADRLTVAVSAEVYRFMELRGVTHRTLGVSRRTLNRCLKAKNVTLSTVADVADALDCDVVIQFKPRPRGISGATGA